MMPTVEPVEISMMTTIKFNDADGDKMAINVRLEDGTLDLSFGDYLDNPFMRVGQAQAAALWPIFKHYAETGILVGYKPPGVSDADR